MESQRLGEDGDGGAQRGPETGVQKQSQEEVRTCQSGVPALLFCLLYN